MSDEPQRPTTNDRNAWRAYWQAQGMPWRTEPEIDAERQLFLTGRLALRPSKRRAVYPFKDLRTKLTRADVEWLVVSSTTLAHPQQRGDGQKEAEWSLDLRGADLREVDLHGLPLGRVRGGLTADEWYRASPHQRAATALLLERANLRRVHLEGAGLRGANLVGSDIKYGHLEGADLCHAQLTGAKLDGVHLEGPQLTQANLDNASLRGAHLEGAKLVRAQLAGASVDEAHLEQANLFRANLHGATLGHVHLAGAKLYEADLTDTFINGSHWEGKAVPTEQLKRVQPWSMGFSSILPPADMRRTFFDSSSRLDGVILGDQQYGCASLADIRWSGANLAVLDWASVSRLGDEGYARQVNDVTGTRKPSAKRLEEFTSAVRANRQLSVALRNQGLNEPADRFAYRAQILQRQVLLRQGHWLRYFGSRFLDTIAGYGYRPGRSILTYVTVIAGFAAAYFLLGSGAPLHLTPQEALFTSIISFHGRGFFPTSFNLANPITPLVALEAMCGLLIEITFIATFTNRFFAR